MVTVACYYTTACVLPLLPLSDWLDCDVINKDSHHKAKHSQRDLFKTSFTSLRTALYKHVLWTLSRVPPEEERKALPDPRCTPVAPGSRRHSGQQFCCRCHKSQTSVSGLFQSSSRWQTSSQTLGWGSSGLSLCVPPVGKGWMALRFFSVDFNKRFKK